MFLAGAALWKTAGGGVIWMAAVTTAVGIISKTPPAKWFWRRLVAIPMKEWGTKVVSDVVEEKVSKSNGGGSIKDQMNLLEESLQRIHDCLDRRFSDTHEWMAKMTVLGESTLAESVGARERIRQLYRPLDIPIFEADGNGSFTYLNPAYCKLAGMTWEAMLGDGWTRCIDPDDRDRVLKFWENSVVNGTPFSCLYSVHNASDGSVVEIQANANPLHEGSEGVRGWTGFLEVLPSGDRMEF